MDKTLQENLKNGRAHSAALGSCGEEAFCIVTQLDGSRLLVCDLCLENTMLSMLLLCMDARRQNPNL